MTTTLTPTETLEAKIDALTDQVAFLAEETRQERRRRERLEELIEDVMPLAREGMDQLAVQLEELQKKGYLDFAKASLGVVDAVVTNFTEEDVRQLGDNVVLILNVVKEMTQPEIMAVVYRMIEAVERQRTVIENEPAEAPSLWQLAKQAREPEVRRGIGRALNTLRAVSDVDAGPPRKYVPKTQDQQADDSNTQGGN